MQVSINQQFACCCVLVGCVVLFFFIHFSVFEKICVYYLFKDHVINTPSVGYLGLVYIHTSTYVGSSR